MAGGDNIGDQAGGRGRERDSGGDEPADHRHGGGPLRAAASRLIPFLVLLLYTGLAVLLFAPAWKDPTRIWIGGGGDVILATWFLRWLQFSAGHGHNPWLTDYMNYPYGINLMWNQWAPLAGFVTWPVQKLFGAIVAYNVFETSALVLSAWSAYFAIRRYVHGHFPAMIGGLLYGFSPYVTAQSLGHPNIAIIVTPPLVLLLLDDIVVRQRRRWWVNGLLLGLVAAVQLLLSEEVLAMEAVVGALVVAVLAVLHLRGVRGRVAYAVKAFGVGLASALVICAWPLYDQFFGPQQLHGNPQGFDIYVSDVFGFVVPTADQWLAPDFATSFSNHFAGNLSEYNAYVGLPLLALCIFALVRWWRTSWVRVTGLCTIGVAILSMGVHLHLRGHRTPIPLPWVAGAHLPILADILASRFTLFMYLGIGLLLAHTLAESRAWRRPRRAGIWALAAVGLLLLVPRTPYPSGSLDVPRFFNDTAALSTIPDGTPLLVAPVAAGVPADALLWQLTSDMRFQQPGGYYNGPKPPHDALYEVTSTLNDIWARGAPARPLDAAGRQRMLTALDANGIHMALAGPSQHHDELVAFLTSLLGTPRQVDDVEIWTGF